MTNSLIPSGLSTTGITHDDRDTAFKVLGGYQFNRNFALEAGYFHLGKFGFTSTTTPAGTLDGSVKLQGLTVDLVGMAPLSERWSALGRVGVQQARVNSDFQGTGAVIPKGADTSKRSPNPKVGVGLQYALTSAVFIRGEAERYRITDATGSRGHVNVYSVGLVFPIGRTPASRPVPMKVSEPAPRVMEPMPAPAPAPTPTPVVVAPVVVPVVVAPVRRRVNFAAESLFGFGSAHVATSGKTALNTFVAELVGAEFNGITVEGHADRLGSTASNQVLSLQRAEAVKAYLVDAGKVSASKITAVGKGESMPITSADTCKAGLSQQQLIACLQPDRRVEVEVSAMQ